MLLHVLGYYRGKCDGIWSELSIKAKRAFERDPKFKPGLPNNGMPFEISVRAKFPVGIYVDVRTGNLAHEKLTSEKISELSSQLVPAYDSRREAVVKEPEAKPEQPASVEEIILKQQDMPKQKAHIHKHKHKKQ